VAVVYNLVLPIFSWNDPWTVFRECAIMVWLGSLVHVTPTCSGSEEESDHFRSYVRSISFLKDVVSSTWTHDIMVTRQQVYHCTRLPILVCLVCENLPDMNTLVMVPVCITVQCMSGFYVAWHRSSIFICYVFGFRSCALCRLFYYLCCFCSLLAVLLAFSG
jgi:hypothetical protein